MKLLHITEDNSKTNFGITTVVNELNNKLLEHKINSKVISPIINSNDKETIYSKPTLNNLMWRHSIELKKNLKNSQDNLFHIHGIWMYPQFIASQIAYKNKIPYIITPHGMLEPWLWENGAFKKKLYFDLMIKKYFSNANILHAITPDEKNNLFNLFGHKNIEVIPNSISYTEIDSYNIQREETNKFVLFVGRLHPKKGIDLLIKAFSKLKDTETRLKIAGPFNEYKNELAELVQSLGIENKVDFLGMVTGKEKHQLFKNAWVFVAPSFSEVVGMVNLEAGVLSTPVITTYQTGLYKEWNDNGGVLINPNEEELLNALVYSLEWSEVERDERGKKLKQFIIEQYSWEKNIYRWIDLYQGMENATTK